jgi:hypothetical protein
VYAQLDGLAQRIIESKAFGRSKTYAKLLRYLVEKTREGDIPKELTIAVDVFGKTDFDPAESTLVRVYVYNLRKKLAAYYKGEGQGDRYRLRIPKGGYAVTVDEQLTPPSPLTVATSPPPPTPVPVTNSRMTSYWLLPLGLALGALAYALIDRSPAPSPFFAELLANDRADMLVLGDMFVYREYDTLTGTNRTIRNARINSFDQFVEREGELGRQGVEISPRGYTFLISNAPKWVQAISRQFTDRGTNDYTLRLRTQLTTEELRKNDLIVVGMTKTIGPFQTVFTASALDYNDYDTFQLGGGDSTATQQFRPSGSSTDYHTDYGLVARFPGPHGNPILLCTGLWDSATTHALDMITQQRLYRQLEATLRRELDEIPPYYEVFFRVNGVELTELDYEILHVGALDGRAVDWGGGY